VVVYEDILREFQRQRVKYIIVGGIAVNLLGLFRNTADLDILVEMTDVNLAKVVSILKKKGYRVKQPEDPMGIADKKIREDWVRNKHMKAFNFYKEEELKEVDIIIETPVPYAKARKNIRHIRGPGLTLPVISIGDLIKMKKITGRTVDNLDIKQLKMVQRLGGRG